MVRHPSEHATATGIYGIIVGSAVLASSHAETAVAIDVAVLVTLLIYWAAERYSRLVAARIHDGARPSWVQVRRELTSGWEFVTASALPLVVLLLTRLAGASLDTAVLAALWCSTLLLCLSGWEIGASGRLSRAERFGVALVAGLFGVAMIVLKSLLH
ncbi:hypothetical protein FE374_12395 [Georgenia yuyongxinii]|uniref:Uncharacterized protein n=1 Tax=Georgenia yuyongxinii TaxID=2589797 RepID=A0A5B8C8A4_9MICO|nr:hypothetical protein FE374_12395 [Georgenia yuyongxinii]